MYLQLSMELQFAIKVFFCSPSTFESFSPRNKLEFGIYQKGWECKDGYVFQSKSGQMGQWKNKYGTRVAENIYFPKNPAIEAYFSEKSMKWGFTQRIPGHRLFTIGMWISVLSFRDEWLFCGKQIQFWRFIKKSWLKFSKNDYVTEDQFILSRFHRFF